MSINSCKASVRVYVGLYTNMDVKMALVVLCVVSIYCAVQSAGGSVKGDMSEGNDHKIVKRFFFGLFDDDDDDYCRKRDCIDYDLFPVLPGKKGRMPIEKTDLRACEKRLKKICFHRSRTMGKKTTITGEDESINRTVQVGNYLVKIQYKNLRKNPENILGNVNSTRTGEIMEDSGVRRARDNPGIIQANDESNPDEPN